MLQLGLLVCTRSRWRLWGAHTIPPAVMAMPPTQSQQDPNPRAEGSIPGRAPSHQHHTGKELHTSSQVVLGASRFFQSWMVSGGVRRQRSTWMDVPNRHVPYSHLKDVPCATGHSHCSLREHLEAQQESKHKEKGKLEAS